MFITDPELEFLVQDQYQNIENAKIASHHQRKSSLSVLLYYILPVGFTGVYPQRRKRC